MIDKILRVTFISLSTILGIVLANGLEPTLKQAFDSAFWSMGLWGTTLLSVLVNLGGGLFGFIFGILIAQYLFRQLLKFTAWVEKALTKFSGQDILLGTLGLFIGLIIANLIGIAFINIPIVGPYISVVLSIILGYTGMHLALGRMVQFSNLFNLFRGAKKETKNNYGKILDTSVIIDGRISDISKTGFLEGPLIVPVFVLEELQHIADSSDILKRNRGRRGLDILNKMQKENFIEIKVVTDNFDDINEVDSKLIKLGHKYSSKIITNDYNLNKVAELQGIFVLNINDLANALKPALIPGDEMNALIVKMGKEHGQGIAYLEDGTMIVVEDGANNIGSEVVVMVTSVLQTSAGRMIFAKIENTIKEL